MIRPLRRWATLASAALGVLMGACAPSPPTISTYAKDGITFQHFSDWRVSEDMPVDDAPNARAITLEGPHEAVVLFLIRPLPLGKPLNEFADAMARRRSKASSDTRTTGSAPSTESATLRSSPIRARLGGQVRDGILQQFSVTVRGQTIPHEARFYDMARKQYNIVVVTQVAAENADDVAPAFDLAMDSFAVMPRD